MRVTCINPALVLLRSDPLTTGIPYMPVSLASAAAAVRQAGHDVHAIDAFAERPRQYRLEGRLMVRGLTPAQVEARVPDAVDLIVLYAGNLTCHHSLKEILERLHLRRPQTPVLVMENTQAVTAYSLRRVMEELFDGGATYVLCGEAEERLPALLDCLREGRAPREIDGIGWREASATQFTPPTRQIADLDALPLPAWELFPLQAYWSLRYAHGALERSRYLPLLTSRGCPYPCKFCVIPETNNLRWRGRSAGHVVAEMAHWHEALGVSEFHIEDVNPTIDEERTKALPRAHPSEAGCDLEDRRGNQGGVDPVGADDRPHGARRLPLHLHLARVGLARGAEADPQAV